MKNRNAITENVNVNPFLTSGYVSSEYFCDREKETEILIREVTHGNNLALISMRRMGKSGLIHHCFQQTALKKNYYTFFIDIYATKSLREFVFAMSKEIVVQLKPFGKTAIQNFRDALRSIKASLSFDINGNPSFELGIGDIKSAETTLDEIFTYLNSADKPCIVAIDEFQQITSYPEDNVEALLRTYAQRCNNAKFIFAGSQRHIMGEIFTAPSRPFFQSVSMMALGPIPTEYYVPFAVKHYKKFGKNITKETIEEIYNRFDGITWYMQKILNVMFSMTPDGGTANIDMLDIVMKQVLDTYRYTYSEILFRIPEKQKELLIAINKEGKAEKITSGDFISKYSLPSASSVQSALKGLLEKDFITYEQGYYQIYDRFFGIWLNENY